MVKGMEKEKRESTGGRNEERVEEIVAEIVDKNNC